MNAPYHPNPHKKPPFPVFLAAFVLLFFCSLSVADSIGFVPDYIDGSTPLTTNGSTPSGTSGNDTINPDTSTTPSVVPTGSVPIQTVTPTTPSVVATPASVPTGINPVRIIIPSVRMNLPVQNPSTTDVDALDALLKAGPAHYIHSADLGQAGNLIIFAHSSHLPVVINKMFQAFNNIPNLKSGDAITLVGTDGWDYNYEVVSVVKASVNDGTTIDTSPTHGTNLTLVTCDTLTGVSARFILTATYIGTSSGN